MRLRPTLCCVLAVPLLLLLAGCGTPVEGGTLYVANLRSSDVSVIDAASGHERARIPVAQNPHELAAAMDGVLVSNYRSGAVTLLRGGGIATSLDLGGEPHGLAVAGGRAAVTLGRAGRVALLDARSGDRLGEVETGGEPHMAAAATDGRLYAVDAARDLLLEIDAAAGAVTRRVAVGRTPETLAVSPDGRTVAVGNARSGDLSLIDADSFTERARVPVPGVPVRVRYSPDGRTLAVSLNDSGRVALLDRDGAVRATVAAGARPDGLAFSPDGRVLYVALSGDHRVAVLGLADRRVLRTIDAGDGPSGLLLLP